MSKKIISLMLLYHVPSIFLKPCPNLVRPLASQVLKNGFEVVYCFVFIENCRINRKYILYFHHNFVENLVQFVLYFLISDRLLLLK